MNMKKWFQTVAACSLLAGSALAQETFPSKPVKMIAPYAAGGGGDILSRAIAQAFTKATGQQMVIENRPGASGMIGAAACKSAVPDGYTYCIPVSDVMVINPFVFKNVPYDPERDFVVVAPVATLILAFVANSSVPASNLKELAAWSKANRATANFASWGVGGAAHLVMAHFNKTMNAEFTHLPYLGIPPMVQAVLSNDAPASLLFYGPIAPHVQAGKIKPIAILGNQRYAPLPNVTTTVEQGFDFSPSVYYGVVAPTGTPPGIVARMSQLIAAAVNSPDVLKVMEAQGMTPLVESPKAFAERLARDRAAWGPIAKSLNLALD